MESRSMVRCCTATVMLLTPREDMASVTEPVTASPTHMMPMTEPMPMMMPSIVSSARILLAFRPFKARNTFSHSPLNILRPLPGSARCGRP